MAVVYVCVLYSRNERLCVSCVRERQQETTSECEDTDTDNELSSSTPPGGGSAEERDSSTVCADDSVPSSSCYSSLLCAADTAARCDEEMTSRSAGVDTAAGCEDEMTSRSAGVDTAAGCDDEMTSRPAGVDVASWSMRGGAYSALSWVSGVMSRSFVRSPTERATDGQCAAGVNAAVDVKADVSQSNPAAVSLDGNYVDDTPSEDVGSSAADSDSRADVDASSAAVQSPVPVTQRVVGVLPCNDSTVTDSSHDLTTSDICQSLPADDAILRYPRFYSAKKL